MQQLACFLQLQNVLLVVVDRSDYVINVVITCISFVLPIITI